MPDIFDEVAKAYKGDIFDDVEIRGKPEGGTRPISTITGKPVPTLGESWKQTGKVFGTALPIAGDVAGTFLAPQLKGSQMGIKLLNILMRGGGAGVGSFGGSAAGQQLEKGGIDWKEAAKEGIIGTAGEAGMGTVGMGLKAVEKPVLKLLSDITFSGSATKSYLTNKIRDLVTQRAERFISDVAPDVVKGAKSNIDDILVRVKSALDEDRLVYDTYENMLTEASKLENGKILMDNTAQMLGSLKGQAESEILARTGKSTASKTAIEGAVLKKLGIKPETGQGYQIKKLLNSDEVTPTEASFLFATVFKRGKTGFNELAPDVRSLREQMKDAMMSDIDTLSTRSGLPIAETKKQADEAWKAIKEFQFLAGLFKDSMTEVAETGKTVLKPYTLGKSILANESKIKATMPDLWPQLKIEAEAYIKAGDKLGDAIELGKDSILSKGLGGFLGTMGLGLKGFPIAEAVGAMSAWSLMSDPGRKVLESLISVGTRVPAKTALHLAGEEINFKPQSGVTPALTR